MPFMSFYGKGIAGSIVARCASNPYKLGSNMKRKKKHITLKQDVFTLCGRVTFDIGDGRTVIKEFMTVSCPEEPTNLWYEMTISNADKYCKVCFQSFHADRPIDVIS
jgi:predicted PolB exonuclease-like 3'-5' exonuclease